MGTIVPILGLYNHENIISRKSFYKVIEIQIIALYSTEKAYCLSKVQEMLCIEENNMN